MNSLMNYGSDGENTNDSDDAKLSNAISKSGITFKQAGDAIYDPVPMDMSEESNNNNSSDNLDSERSPLRPLISDSLRTSSIRNTSSFPDQRRIDHEERSLSSHDDHKSNDNIHEIKVERHHRNTRHSSDKKSDDKKRGNDYKDSKELRKNKNDDKKFRDEKKSRDGDRRNNKCNRDDKNDDKNERDHHRDDRRDKDRRDDRDKRRDRDRDRGRDRDRIKERSRDISRDKSRDKDRDRRHMKDEKFRDRHKDDRRSRDKERVRSRSRSKSRSRDRGLSHRSFSYREGRNKTKLAQLEKLGIEIKTTDGDTVHNSQEQNYYNPLATATQGKYAEQIQKRKLLWANKKQDDNKSSTAVASTTNTWVGTTFTHDQDGKVTAKFKRLMGIKEDIPTTLTSGIKPDILKKQEEMFNNMEQQYEVARATTHTQRGVGLGYASGSFSFPR